MPASGTTQTRRSHTKSRNGCKTCKKRHIRCDESFPQCGNCTKHNVRCDYMDQPDAETSQTVLGTPDLKMTPQIERDIRQWRETGVSPFPSLGVTEQPALTLAQYSNTDLRLIYHISSIAVQMQNAEAQQRSVWVRRVPLFLKLAANYDFVMHALLALSASHLSWLTACPATLQLSYHHRGIALKGLPEAIGKFSKENADAILAASILLSWQATDCQGWQSLMQGTATVVNSMQPFQEESEFGEYLEENNFFHEASGPIQLSPVETARLLDHIFNSLQILVPFVQGREEESRGLNDLIFFVRNLADSILLLQSAAEQFERLHPLRSWLFFLPISFLKRAREDEDVLILLAHFYAVALAVEPLFPAVGAAWFGSLAVGPILEIHKNLVKQHQSMTPLEKQRRWPIHLMEFPLEVVRDFRIRMGWRRADEVATEAYAAQEMQFPSSPSVSGSSEGTVGRPVTQVGEGDVVFDITQFSDIQVRPLSNEDFYGPGLWRGWSTASN
ncbi:hypothetical protein L211DRAFT_262604 [Terfezia boudieri ATCC MYA-4762]|uniref:Zn(2)-C6 fungal-type domain-containing protein n=1 Tax=Terfezia boudieri ATCC MYA-4762 TaxID=1051890 RepID=A0A3N4M9F2_9PEZI|nr:hypothetical protein L211DRAFT_262604 [Terfezia boudieri ATCC MYA-4762]